MKLTELQSLYHDAILEQFPAESCKIKWMYPDSLFLLWDGPPHHTGSAFRQFGLPL